MRWRWWRLRRHDLDHIDLDDHHDRQAHDDDLVDVDHHDHSAADDPPAVDG